VFETVYSRKIYCSRRCHQRAKDVAKGFGHRGRARLYGAPYETIDKPTIYERDGWRCGICRRQVHKHLAWPHLGAAVLDHVVPLSTPGTPGHVPSNVQCAHNRCNTVKRADIGQGVQPALF
jgi:5-methylcytosine-specific restriction endonuclease McrA